MRIVLVIMFCVATLTLSVGVSPAAATSGADGVWVNTDAFSYHCMGYTDNYASWSSTQAKNFLSGTGYSNTYGATGAGFTRSAFLSKLGPEYAIYIHTHGDIYNSSSIKAAFLQDPGSGNCNSYTRDYISAAQVQANAVPPYQLVIMSTCYLGSRYQPHTGSSHPNMMPEAFGIPKTQTTGTNRFYLGYVYSTYDSASYAFEGKMFGEMYENNIILHWTLAQYFTWAQSQGPYDYPDSADPFVPAWYGDSTLVLNG